MRDGLVRGHHRRLAVGPSASRFKNRTTFWHCPPGPNSAPMAWLFANSTLWIRGQARRGIFPDHQAGLANTSSKNSVARRWIPGKLLSRGPAIFSVWGQTRLNQWRTSSILPRSIRTHKQGLPACLAIRCVNSVPPLSCCSKRINVASLSRTFCRVRTR